MGEGFIEGDRLHTLENWLFLEHNGVCTLAQLRGFESGAVAVKNPSLHFACSRTGQSGERVRKMKRRIVHSDSSVCFRETLTRSRKLLRRVGVGIREPLEEKGLQSVERTELSFTNTSSVEEVGRIQSAVGR